MSTYKHICTRLTVIRILMGLKRVGVSQGVGGHYRILLPENTLTGGGYRTLLPENPYFVGYRVLRLRESVPTRHLFLSGERFPGETFFVKLRS